MLNWDDPRLAHLERAGRAAWVWDTRSERIVWATDEAARLWGLEDAFLLVDRPFAATDPATEDLVLASAALAHTEGIDAEIRLWQSGRPRALSIMARRFARSPSGDLVLFTQRTRPQHVAAEGGASNPIADLLGTFPLGLAVFSPLGRCLYANPAFERILGPYGHLTFNELMGSRRGGERLIRALLGAGSVRVTPTLVAQGAEMTLQIDAALVEDASSGRSAFLVQAEDITARRGRERQLSERFEALKALLQTAVEAWAVLGRKLEVRTLGGQAFDDWGEDALETIGRPWTEAVPLLGIAPNEELEKALLARQPAEIRLGVDSGRVLKAVPNWSEDGDFIGYHLIVSTSELVREEPREVSEAKPETEAPKSVTASALDLGTVALIAHDNFDIVYANERAARLFGADSSKALVGRPFLELFPVDERRASRHYDEIVSGGPPVAENRLAARNQQGDELTLDAEFRCVLLGGKRVALASFQDVTALAATEAELKTRAEDTLAWMDAAPMALALLDSGGRVMRVNAQAVGLLQKSPQDLEGRPFDELIDRSDSTAYEIRRAACASMAPGAAAMLEVNLTTRPDHTTTALLSMRPAPFLPEPGIVVGITNIEAHLETERELRGELQLARERNTQKTEFLSSVSHEMRTPLNAIIGFSEFMREGRLGPISNEKYAGYIEDIHMSGQHLLSLVNDLLDMSKIESGRYEVDLKSVDVAAVVDQAVRIVRPSAEKKAVAILTSVMTDLPHVLADQRSLRQIFLNLLSNAIKFTPGTGRITVTANLDPIAGVTIEVRDTGVGMSEADLQRALEPYRQVQIRHANDEPGTGLGLPLAKALTEANHALFHIESAPDEGTRVTITFPIGQVVSRSLLGN